MGISSVEILILAGAAAFITAFALGIILISLMCRLSWRWGAIDKPDGSLKCHVRPTPTLGGAPLFGAILAGMGILAFLNYSLSAAALGDGSGFLSWLPLAVSGLIILSMGVRDDLRHVKPRTKFFFQMMAGLVLIGSGLIIGRFGFFGLFEVSLGILAVPFTLFWLVGSCNAFNFIDGMDGLASGIGMALALVLAAFGFINGAYAPAVVSLAVAGGLLALLLFNFKPALIFLGDSGSQLVGLLLGALVIETTTKNGVFDLPSAGIILSIPVLDALLSILRRYSRSESPACGDHQHVHHHLRRYGMSVRQVSLTLMATALVCGAVALGCRIAEGYWVAAGGVILVGLEIFMGVRLGCLEPEKLWQRMQRRHPGQPVGEGPGSCVSKAAELAVIWERMKPLFEQMQLDRAILTLEGISENGRQRYHTFKWARSDALTSASIAGTMPPSNRWTKRFLLGPDQSQIATLRLEAIEKASRAGESLLHDEQRIARLLKQISDNIRTTTRKGVSLTGAAASLGITGPGPLTETAADPIEELIDAG
ncbi:MAG: hypothetical protein AMJ79_07190 [Phycisphaerae bacterium SM23_30]|nr:MAG: hypothetical protein AMJ79_07190 [Phycisphaerae bacterium SM23_30]